MVSKFKEEKFIELIRKIAAEYIVRNANRTSLITVTSVDFDDVRHQAHIRITVLPEHQERAALDFLNRNVSEFRDYFMKKANVGHIPFFTFVSDSGEKNRQRIDQLV